MIRKRHDSEEVAAKLEKAYELASSGANQQEIARQLGVSVMTIHRWRKQQGKQANNSIEKVAVGVVSRKKNHEDYGDEGLTDQIRELELENTRLRRLITDLLLEKMKLEERIQLSYGELRVLRRKYEKTG